jgi:hypothetical protein
MNIIFLDIDGVLNCQVFYENYGYPTGKTTYEQENICSMRLKWIQDLCKDTNSQIVISSTWRLGRTIGYFEDTFINLGVELPILGLTPLLSFSHSYNSVPRGCEIKEYLNKYQEDYSNYAIIDDDGDMLLEQASHFFQTDAYAGLTPWTCQKIKDFFTK